MPKFLIWLAEKYDGDFSLMLAYYNGGSNAAETLKEMRSGKPKRALYAETAKYIPYILDQMHLINTPEDNLTTRERIVLSKIRRELANDTQKIKSRYPHYFVSR